MQHVNERKVRRRDAAGIYAISELTRSPNPHGASVISRDCEKRNFFPRRRSGGARKFITDIGEFSEGMIEAVGKPVLKGSMDDYYGSWMHDASFRHDGTPDKLWVTRKNDTSYIFEYISKDYFKNDTARPIKLPYPFQVGLLIPATYNHQKRGRERGCKIIIRIRRSE